MSKIMYMNQDVGGTVNSAENITYDNTESGLEANTIQGAIDEVNQNLENQYNPDSMIDISSYVNALNKTFTIPSDGIIIVVAQSGDNEVSGAYRLTSQYYGIRWIGGFVGAGSDMSFNNFVKGGDTLTVSSYARISSVNAKFIPYN